MPHATTSTLGEELRRPANLLSLLRVPLGVAAFAARAHTVAILWLMAAAAISDMLDGFVARRTGGDHTVGTWLDPVCDKVFVVSVVLGVWVDRHPPLWIVLATLVREVLVVPAVMAHLVAPGREDRPVEYRARPLGKATTVAQFALLFAVLLGRMDLAAPAAGAAAVLGFGAAVDYALRVRAALHA